MSLINRQIWFVWLADSGGMINFRLLWDFKVWIWILRLDHQNSIWTRHPMEIWGSFAVPWWFWGVGPPCACKLLEVPWLRDLHFLLRRVKPGRKFISRYLFADHWGHKFADCGSYYICFYSCTHSLIQILRSLASETWEISCLAKQSDWLKRLLAQTWQFERRRLAKAFRTGRGMLRGN